MHTVRESVKGIDDIFIEVETLPSSQARRSTVSWVGASDVTVLPSDFISEVGVEQVPNHGLAQVTGAL